MYGLPNLLLIRPRLIQTKACVRLRHLPGSSPRRSPSSSVSRVLPLPFGLGKHADGAQTPSRPAHPCVRSFPLGRPSRSSSLSLSLTRSAVPSSSPNTLSSPSSTLRPTLSPLLPPCHPSSSSPSSSPSPSRPSSSLACPSSRPFRDSPRRQSSHRGGGPRLTPGVRCSSPLCSSPSLGRWWAGNGEWRWGRERRWFCV